MTQRVQAWAESWPVFLVMCLWLLIWGGMHLVQAEGQRPARDDVPSNAAQAADGIVVHRVD